MTHPNYKYVDFALKSLSARYIINIASSDRAIAKADQAFCAQSWYRFPQEVADKKTTKGYKGACVADYIPFDFDNAEAPDQALEEARKFVAALQVNFEVKPETLQYFFSGKKGMHVLIPSEVFGGFQPSTLLPKVLKGVSCDLMGDLEADKSIYDRQRVLRCTNTIHQDSGLFKIALTVGEFLNSTWDDIKEFAKAPRSVLQSKDLIPVPALIEIYQKHLRGTNEKPTPTMQTTGQVFRGQLSEGDGRDNAAFNIACYLRDGGVKSGTALQILRLWDSTNIEPLTETDGEDILQVKIGSAYGEGQEHELTLNSIKSMEELAESYAEYVENLSKKRVYLGFHRLDKAIRGISPGELVFLLARSSVGKSTFIQNIQRNIASQGQATLFVSLEQPLPQCFERTMQMVSGLAGDAVEDIWKVKEERNVLLDKAITELPHTFTVGVSLTVDGIEEAVRLAEEKAAMEMSCILVDYLGYIDMPGGGSITERVSETARELKKMAKRINRALICAAQVSRGSGEDGTKPLSISSARDSGAVEDSAEVLLGMYRKEKEPDMAFEGNIEWTMQILKNKKGHLGSMDMETERRTLRMWEV